jgi:hypothetical protein
MLAQYLDLAPKFNSQAGTVVIDVSNYDYILVQPIGSTISFQSTIDSGAVQGVTDGNAKLATNFTAVQGTLVLGGTTGTSVTSTNTIRFNVVGRYLKMTGTAPITKLLVMLAKIS